ncbi:MAG: efflux transporter periplasmic adaptor subunit [Cereibacter sphaeroides]|uniref:Efflux transporter periplasmic adaptor subunit n=1 Tax=Cereibacter sphaeroides TaxID=1063 RepID=A0A2W5SBF3_CERSP|nr:MAG: efflux transporter periplasmic adaptor subunit [Cereibacter sphaeroides]
MPILPFKARPALRLVLALGLVTFAAGCRESEEEAETEARPVRVVVVEESKSGDTISLAGTVESKVQADLGFRISGRMVERLVNVGENVEAGQLLARLDPTDEENGVRSAEAALTAAEAQLSEARANYDRQRQLYDRGFLARAGYERAEATLNTANAQADSARAQYGIAARRLNDTSLYADAPGVVTATGAEAGEVVTAGRSIVQIARDGGLDAVFDVPAGVIETSPADPIVTVALSQSPNVSAEGRIREVAPRADAVTGTFRVRVGLIAPPAELRLGSTVTGTAVFDETNAIEIPATALTRADGEPAVWIVDQAAQTVSLRPVEVERFLPLSVVIAGGLEPGEMVVTAGVQALRPGQAVRVPGASS